MDLTNLNDVELEKQLFLLSGNERATTLTILYHLIELERRQSFREIGYSSLFDYCTRRLRYSEGSAYKRVTGARCLREFPELGELILKGEITICSIALAAESLRAKRITVTEIIGKSKREVGKLVLKEEVSAKPKERIAPIVISIPKAPLLPEEPKEERVSFKFSLSKGSYEQFLEVKSLLSNSLGNDLSAEAVFSKLMERFLSVRKKKITTRSRSRYIPRSFKQLVRERDGGQCSYVSPDGTQCTERHHLHIDHIVPFAVGGKSEPENLRLLCATHNKLMAEQHFGREFINAHC